MIDNEFTTMRAIGRRFGATSHEVGRWLVEIGLRTQDREPSEKAQTGGYCARQRLENAYRSFVVWHKARTIAALEQAGHRQVINPPPIPAPTTTQFVGPFTLQENGEDGFLIQDGDGVTSLWAYSDEMARKVVKLMNLADRRGYFG